MSQLACGVENHLNMAWMPTMGIPTCLQKLGSFRMSKTIAYSTEGVRVGEKGPFESMFLRHPLTHPKSFHDLILPVKRTIPSCFGFDKFDFSRVLSVKKGR